MSSAIIGTDSPCRVLIGPCPWNDSGIALTSARLISSGTFFIMYYSINICISSMTGMSHNKNRNKVNVIKYVFLLEVFVICFVTH